MFPTANARLSMHAGHASHKRQTQHNPFLEVYELVVKDLASHEHLPDSVEKISGYFLFVLVSVARQ